ncbi:MAG: hypothetical protein GAK40_00074 [Burkholderia plantarii]|nr:MAG: hypothetical protein GAK40_00074 [Burkholderia plantarii]
MSQKRGLAIFIGSAIALAVSYAATYTRFHPETAATPPAAPTAAAANTAAPSTATPSPPAPLSSGLSLPNDFPILPPSSPLSWAHLSLQQRAALAPFELQWDNFSEARKRKWLKIAARFPRLSAEEQKRLHERMTQWAGMTSEQRRVARENYQAAKDLSTQARERAWRDYQKLTPEQKAKLAAAERRRRPTVVSAPPSGKSDRDINRLVTAHDHPANAALTPLAPTNTPAPAPQPASGPAQPGGAPQPLSPNDAASIYKGS